jgi:polar amino acid transport system substrate-binding protein
MSHFAAEKLKLLDFAEKFESLGRFMRRLLRFFMVILVCGCGKSHHLSEIHFAISADYPPFEYTINGEFAGFDIDLAAAIGKELGKKVLFHDMTFNSIFPALNHGNVDAAISTITATSERSRQFDFSLPYFREELFVLLLRGHSVPQENLKTLNGLRVACQMGTTMEIWLRHHGKFSQLFPMDNNNQAVEALKSGNVDAVVIDRFQALKFCSLNKNLRYSFLAKSDDFYAIAFRRSSPLHREVNAILAKMNADGRLAELRKKWGIDDSE